MSLLEECTVDRSCWMCGSNDQTILFGNNKIPTVSPRDTSSFKLVRCKQCGVVRVNPAPCKESLISYYPNDYYREDSNINNLLYNVVRKFYGRNRFEVFLTKLSSDTKTKKKVLEIGPGRGDNLVPFLKQGYSAFAIEPNEKLADVIKGLGVNVVNCFFERASNMPSDFDAVILSHVLEHEYDPKKMLAYCKEHMKGGAYIYVEVPVLDATSFRVFGRYWGDLEFPLHLSLMKRSHLEKMLELAGFSIIERKYKTLIGDTTRSFEKIFGCNSSNNNVKKVLVDMLGATYQLLFILLNKLTRKGDAVVVIAKNA